MTKKNYLEPFKKCPGLVTFPLLKICSQLLEVESVLYFLRKLPGNDLL